MENCDDSSGFITKILFIGVFVFVSSLDPVVAFNPKTYNNILTITVININGIKTINHEITLNPPSHKTFNKNVTKNATIDLKNAVLYCSLNISIIICVHEKIR